MKTMDRKTFVNYLVKADSPERIIVSADIGFGFDPLIDIMGDRFKNIGDVEDAMFGYALEIERAGFDVLVFCEYSKLLNISSAISWVAENYASRLSFIGFMENPQDEFYKVFMENIYYDVQCITDKDSLRSFVEEQQKLGVVALV